MMPKLAESIALKSLNKKFHCQHEYAEKTWICVKCGYEIRSDVLRKIAETSWGKIGRTTVY